MNADAENALGRYTNESAEAERCESIELDDEIRNLIEKNSISQSCENAEFIAQERVLRQRTLCSLKTSSGTDIRNHIRPSQTDMNGSDTSADQSQKCTLLTKRKNIPTGTLEHQIITLEREKQELLEVNKEWDQQFRSMKRHYEIKLAEVKAKLGASQRTVSELEKEKHRNQQECERLQALARERPAQDAKEKEILNDALNELKEENKLLKEQKASVTKRKEYYQSEINRLNKALQDALQKQHSSFHVPHLDKSDRTCSYEEMRTQLEVLRQQVQIYEEDFKKERADRERLNEEKEALQKLNERTQSQLTKLNSQMKAFQLKKELEKQLKQQPDYQWYVPDQFPPDVQHKANDTSSKKEVRH